MSLSNVNPYICCQVTKNVCFPTSWTKENCTCLSVTGRRGVFDGTVENMHLHWKYKELVKILVKGKSFPQVKHIAINLEAESGGVLISLDKTSKGYAIIVYRGKNYQRPQTMRPKNLLTKRQALARSIELQRREVNNILYKIISCLYIYI